MPSSPPNSVSGGTSRAERPVTAVVGESLKLSKTVFGDSGLTVFPSTRSTGLTLRLRWRRRSAFSANARSLGRSVSSAVATSPSISFKKPCLCAASNPYSSLTAWRNRGPPQPSACSASGTVSRSCPIARWRKGSSLGSMGGMQNSKVRTFVAAVLFSRATIWRGTWLYSKGSGWLRGGTTALRHK